MRLEKINDVLGTANRGNPAESGLCTLCRADCAGKCETWKSSLVGRIFLYPRDLFADNRETAKETGITSITDANNESAKEILLS